MDLIRGSKNQTILTNSWEISTEKARIPSNNAENDSQGTWQLVVQETRSVISSRVEAHKTYTKGVVKTHFCTFFFAFSNTYSDSSKKLAGFGTETTLAKGCSLFHNLKEDDCVVEARNSSSRKRWSSGILEIEGRIYVWASHSHHIGQLNFVYIIWKLAEDTRKDFSFVLILIHKKFFTSVLSKVVRERILWIRFYWTPCWFPIASLTSFTMSEAFSTYTPSFIQDWLLEEQFMAEIAKRYSFQPLIPWTKIGWAGRDWSNQAKACCIQTEVVGSRLKNVIREYAPPRDEEKGNCAKGWIRSNERSGPVLEVRVCKTIGRFCVEV